MPVICNLRNRKIWIDYLLTRQQCLYSFSTMKAIETSAAAVDRVFEVKYNYMYIHSKGKQNRKIKRDNCAFTSWSADKMIEKIFYVNCSCFSCYYDVFTTHNITYCIYYYKIMIDV